MKGSQIRKMRESLGLTIAELAQVLHVHAVTLNRWELAKRVKPEGPVGALLSEAWDLYDSGAVSDQECRDFGDQVRNQLRFSGPFYAFSMLVRVVS